MNEEGEDSVFLHKEPCPSCGSRDNLGRYSDGHGFCFGCGHHEPGEGKVTHSRRYSRMTNSDLMSGEFRPLLKRCLSEETCRKFGYMQGKTSAGRPVQIAPYRDKDGEIVAQKLRFPNKEMPWVGIKKGVGLFGAHLWNKGKKIVITEGEIDCMSVSQVQNHKWPVVSLTDGACESGAKAKKCLARNMEFLEGFEEVILMFDQDEPGRASAVACAELFAPGRCKIAHLPLKDPNELLVASRGDEIVRAIWNAKPYRPDGIVAGNELWDVISVEDENHSIPYPWEALNDKTRGIRKGELTTFTAGSGMGKTAVVREIAHHLIQQGESVGMLMLEETIKRTGLGLMGIAANKPLHICREGVSETDLKSAFDATLGTGRVHLYDHFGSTDIDNLLNRVRYMAKALGCGWVILDHLSIVVSGLGDGDERRLIDNAMTMLRTLVQETGIGLIVVSHLKRPEGKGHEDGAQTSLSQLRGSASIAQLSDMVIALERNQQDEQNPNFSTIRVLKNRFSGETGIGCYLIYEQDTGRLREGTESDRDNSFKDETLDDDIPF